MKPSLTIQMKAVSMLSFQALFDIKFQSLLMKPYYVTIHTKAIEQYFHVVLFVILYKVVVNLKVC